MNQRMPALFISHGSPMIALMEPHEDVFVKNLSQFATTIEEPRTIVVVSAHGLSQKGKIFVSSTDQVHAVHDFGGFPRALYEQEFNRPGNPVLASRVVSLLNEARMDASLTGEAGVDHGVWVPLKILYPKQNIPVVQITMPYLEDPRQILKMGQTLSALRKEGVLLVGSGGAVHNLSKLNWAGKKSIGEDWAIQFEVWLKKTLKAKNIQDLLEFIDLAPFSSLAHPTAEHFHPIFFTLGSALMGDEAMTIHEGIEYGSLSMFSFALQG